jgi:electron transfer flavoprotein alpha subunit
VANILCYVELSDGEATPSSLEVLGQARRLGTTLGATVFATLAMSEAPGYGDDDLITKIAAGGADKIVLVVSQTLGENGAAPWDAEGGALSLAWDSCQPALTLVPATCAGRELGARAAARVGAAYLHEAFVEVRDGELLIGEGAGEHARLFGNELDFPVVVTVPPGRYAGAAGDEEAEVEVVQGTLNARFVEDRSARRDAPLQARLSVPASMPDLALPPALRDAERAVIDNSAVLIELETGKGPLRIALGPGAAQLPRADFAAEGAPAELLSRMFADLTVPRE